MKETLLKVVGVEPITDKYGHSGKKVTLAEIEIVGNRECPTRVVTSTNFWAKRTFEPKIAGGAPVEIDADLDFLTVEVGQFYAGGQIFACKTTPYAIDGRMVDSWKGVVFKGQDPLKVAARALMSNNAAPKFINADTGLLETYVLKAQTVVANPNGKTANETAKSISVPAADDTP